MTFPPADGPLLARLADLALQCWRIFELRGYARVDFRVDETGQPWVLEVNANPCLAPDSGFVATAEQAGCNFTQVVQRIIAASCPAMLPWKNNCPIST
jgi:D-alanine-D-alanine ligase